MATFSSASSRNRKGLEAAFYSLAVFGRGSQRRLSRERRRRARRTAEDRGIAIARSRGPPCATSSPLRRRTFGSGDSKIPTPRRRLQCFHRGRRWGLLPHPGGSLRPSPKAAGPAAQPVGPARASIGSAGTRRRGKRRAHRGLASGCARCDCGCGRWVPRLPARACIGSDDPSPAALHGVEDFVSFSRNDRTRRSSSTRSL